MLADKLHLYKSYAGLGLQHVVHEEQRICSCVQLFGIVLSTCTRLEYRGKIVTLASYISSAAWN